MEQDRWDTCIMAKHAKKGPSNVNRLLLRRWSPGQTEDRLWDRSGRLWSLVSEDLDEPDTSELFFDPSVQVAIYEGASTLRWIEPTDRRTAWSAIRDRAFNDAWKPPSGAPGALPFEAQEWRSNGNRLLLFDDHD